MTTNKPTHLFGCCCCGKRWLDIPEIGMACPWCFSSVMDLGKLPGEAIAPMEAAGIRRANAGDTIYLPEPIDG